MNYKINHPDHYNTGRFEVIDVIDDWKLNFELGNVIKYVARAGHKENTIEDLKKAMWYLDREIQNQTKTIIENHEIMHDELKKKLMEDTKVYRTIKTKDGKTYNIVKRKLKNGKNKYMCDKSQILDLKK